MSRLEYILESRKYQIQNLRPLKWRGHHADNWSYMYDTCYAK